MSTLWEKGFQVVAWSDMLRMPPWWSIWKGGGDVQKGTERVGQSQGVFLGIHPKRGEVRNHPATSSMPGVHVRKARVDNAGDHRSHLFCTLAIGHLS